MRITSVMPCLVLGTILLGAVCIPGARAQNGAEGGTKSTAKRLSLYDVPIDLDVRNLTLAQFLPMLIAENSLTAVKPVAHSLAPGAGFAVLCGYAVIALAAGGWALARRDA